MAEQVRLETQLVDEPPLAEPSSMQTNTWQRFVANRTALAALTLLGLIAVLAVLVPELSSRSYTDQDLSRAFSRPFGSDGLLGTDALGRDLAVRLAFGLRLSLAVAIFAVFVQLLIGVPIGLVAGYFGGKLDDVLMRVVDTLLSLPALLLALIVAVNVKVVAEQGDNWWGAFVRWSNDLTLGLAPVLVSLTIFSWLYTARLLRGAGATVRQRDFVRAARAMGSSDGRIIGTHLLPSVVPEMVVASSIAIPAAILTEATLSFFSLGVDPPVPSLGLLITEGSQSINSHAFLVVVPSLALALVTLLASLVADGVRHAVDPTSPSRPARSTDAVTVPSTSPAIEVSPDDFGDDDSVLRAVDITVVHPGDVVAVDGVSLAVARSQRIAIVGESGSGKSTLAAALLGLVEAPSHATGTVDLDGVDLGMDSASNWSQVRGGRIAVVFQDALRALHPLLSVGSQIAEVARRHDDGLDRRGARRRAAELLGQVGVPDPERVARQKPHQLSGGMRQRALIALALAGDPDVLIADEPTTALDVTIQAQILDLLRNLSEERGLAVVLITHDVGVVAGFAERVAVMYAGRIVEDGTVEQVLRNPGHPYTAALVAAAPDVEAKPGGRLVTIPGAPPDLRHLSAGCAFAPRCQWVEERCRSERPELSTIAPHRVACHRSDTP